MKKTVFGSTRMNRCYKCGTTEELSKHNKSSMICKSCRRERYRAYKTNQSNKLMYDFNIPKTDADPEWIERAMNSVKRISARFR